jgi:hypothetical protein
MKGIEGEVYKVEGGRSITMAQAFYRAYREEL